MSTAWKTVTALALACSLGATAHAAPFDRALARLDPSSGRLSVPDVAERAVKSVVNISVTHTKVFQRGPAFTDPFFDFGRRRGGPPLEQRTQSAGSGVIVSADGLVLTNNHVVQGATELRVTLADGRDLLAKVVGTDPKTDIAVIRIDDAEDLVPLEIGDAKALRLGETVLAIGNPFGLGHTVTMGIVSATGRAGMGIVDYEDFIQTDAAINPGNSGGALVDMRGRLVGINTAIFSRNGGYQGIGFAVPTNLASKVMDALVADGRVRRGWLGVGIQNLDSGLVEQLGLASSHGALISHVTPNTPASKAGLMARDVVVALDTTKVRNSSQLRNTISLTKPGKLVKLDILRAGRPLALDVTLGEMPGQAGEPPREPASRRGRRHRRR